MRPGVRLIAIILALSAFAGDLAAEASRVSIELLGQIAPKCGLSGADGQLDFGSVGAVAGRQERAIAFTVDCNTPFTYAMSSTNGEMRGESGASGAAGPSGRLPYQVLLTIPTDNGGTLRKSCDSTQLASTSGQGAACEADSGEATSMGRAGALTVSWGAAGRPPLAGQYSDNLRISITPKY
jgi:spore coat protein U-like protein